MTARIDLSDYGLIDTHCHPFKESTKVLTENEFAFMGDYICGFNNPAFLTSPDVLDEYSKATSAERLKLDEKYRISSTDAELRLHVQNLALQKRMMRELSVFLGCAPNPKDIVEARNRKSANYSEYIKRVFDDAKIQGLNVDDGYSELAVRFALAPVDIDALRTYVPAKVWRTTRVEPLFQIALDKSKSFDEMESVFLSSLDNAVKKLGAVCFKCVIAYRSGLRITKTEPEDAKKDFRKYKAKRSKADVVAKGERALKNLRNYMIWKAVERSTRLGVPFLFHTGVGDQDIVLTECNPTCLWDMLVDEELRHARVVLVHVGYPYISEAAYLTAVLPNVYLDLSILIPLGQTNPSRISQVLEMAPLSKVMYASDVHLPDMYWLSAKIGKSMLGQSLSQVVDAGVLTENEAYDAAKLILTENARRFFKV